MNAYTGATAHYRFFATDYLQLVNHANQQEINTDAVSGRDIILDGWKFHMAISHRKVIYSRKVIWFLRGAIAFMLLALVSWVLSIALMQEWPFHAAAAFFMIAASFLGLWIKSAEHEWRNFTETN